MSSVERSTPIRSLLQLMFIAPGELAGEFAMAGRSPPFLGEAIACAADFSAASRPAISDASGSAMRASHDRRPPSEVLLMLASQQMDRPSENRPVMRCGCWVRRSRRGGGTAQRENFGDDAKMGARRTSLTVGA